ncbi:MAG: FlgO family outer membrane protein [Myxococcaceae bacterium]
MHPLAIGFLSVFCAAAPPTIAVSYFDNNAKAADLEPLRKGLADMLITDLVKVKGIQVVEREKLEVLMKELKLADSGFLDPKTAQRIGKGLQANYVLTGAYLLVGEQLRIDARLVAVASGEVVAADKVEGKRADFFDMQKDLGDLVIRSLGVTAGFEERKELRRMQTRSFEAFVSYAHGLDEEDRGDEAKAAAFFRKALEADPEFRSAKGALERIGVIEKRAEQSRSTEFDQSFAALDKSDPELPKKLRLLLTKGAGFDPTPESIRRRIRLLDFILANDLRPVDTVMDFPFCPEPAIFFNTFPIATDRELSKRAAPAFEYFLLRYPDEMYTKSWLGTWKAMKDGSSFIEAPAEVRKEGLRVIGILEGKLKKARGAAAAFTLP